MALGVSCQGAKALIAVLLCVHVSYAVADPSPPSLAAQLARVPGTAADPAGGMLSWHSRKLLTSSADSLTRYVADWKGLVAAIQWANKETANGTNTATIVLMGDVAPPSSSAAVLPEVTGRVRVTSANGSNVTVSGKIGQVSLKNGFVIRQKGHLTLENVTLTGFDGVVHVADLGKAVLMNVTFGVNVTSDPIRGADVTVTGNATLMTSGNVTFSSSALYPVVLDGQGGHVILNINTETSKTLYAVSQLAKLINGASSAQISVNIS